MKAVSLVMLIMFLGIIAQAEMLKSTAVGKYFDRSRSDFREREAMKELLNDVVRSFNDLVFLDADDEKNPVMESIRIRYAEYNLVIKDISGGINLNFFPDADLSDPGMAEFLFSGNSAEGFLRFRRNNGFADNVSSWKVFLKEEALGAVVCYGWFSVYHAEAETCRMLAASFGKPTEELFPLMNNMPLINVNTADTAILLPLLSRRSWQINGAAAKSAALKNRLEQSSVTEGELRSILGLAENHEVFRYLGVRTSFWAVSFKKGKYRMDAIIAAIPEKGSKTISHYTLIEGKLKHEF